ncbi:MAG: hypothetical protein ACT4OO_12780 [Nitrospiraceae bacterium]
MIRRIKHAPVMLLQIIPSQNEISPTNPFGPSASQRTIIKFVGSWTSLSASIVRGYRRLQSRTIQFVENFDRGGRRIYETADISVRTRGKMTALASLSHEQARRWKTRVKVVLETIREWQARGDAQPRMTVQRTVDPLREQVSAQQAELSNLRAQVAELRVLALSQQQVLLHFGKELEAESASTVVLDQTSGQTARKTSRNKNSRQNRA